MIRFYKSPKLSTDLEILSIKNNVSKSKVPFFGGISAGFPSPADDFVEERISLDELLLNHSESTYLIRVAGDSMIPEYEVGDLLVVRSDLEPKHNSDIIVSVNSSEYTLKRFDEYQNKLLPLNKKYKPIELHEGDNALILGVVVSLIRDKKG